MLIEAGFLLRSVRSPQSMLCKRCSARSIVKVERELVCFLYNSLCMQALALLLLQAVAWQRNPAHALRKISLSQLAQPYSKFTCSQRACRWVNS